MRPREQDSAVAPDQMLLAMAIEHLRGGAALGFVELCERLGFTTEPLDELTSQMPRRLRALLLANVRRETGREQRRLQKALTLAVTRGFVEVEDEPGNEVYRATGEGLRWSILTHEQCGRDAAHSRPEFLATSLCNVLLQQPDACDATLMARIVPLPDVDDPTNTEGKRAMFAAMRSERPRVLTEATRAAIDLGWLEWRDGIRSVTAKGRIDTEALQSWR